LNALLPLSNDGAPGTQLAMFNAKCTAHEKESFKPPVHH